MTPLENRERIKSNIFKSYINPPLQKSEDPKEDEDIKEKEDEKSKDEKDNEELEGQENGNDKKE